MSLSLKPKRAKPLSRAKDAWWYDEKGFICVYIEPKDGSLVLGCTIKRSELIKYIKRSDRT